MPGKNYFNLKILFKAEDITSDFHTPQYAGPYPEILI